MATSSFDPAAYKETTHRQWQTAAKAWNDWGSTLRTWLGPATETMIELAGIKTGSRVLDVAAGAGDQSLQVAEHIGDKGFVLATDISSNILDYAAANARAQGYSQIDFKIMDGEDISVEPESFDAAISRVGLIYFPDQMKALEGIKKSLKPGGRFAAIVYSTPENNKFFSLPVSIIRERAKLPPPVEGQPGPFSLGQPGFLAGVLRQAGFSNIQEKIVKAPLALPSAADCVSFERESFGALHQMLSGLDQSEQESIWIDIEKSLSQFESVAGFSGPCELVVVSGQK